MCEKATSHLFKVREREMLIHTIHSHSATREAFGLNGIDPNIIEVEWIESVAMPSIRFNGQDAQEQQLVRDWYANRFENRLALMFHCVERCKGGYLDLGGLTSAKGLVLPQSINGYLYLGGLTSVKGLVLPQSIRGDLCLGGLTSAKGLVLPQSIRGSLYLGGLTSAKGLVLPQSIGGSLYLGGLTSAKGLVLPQSIGGSLYLGGLTSAKGLVLPQSIGGYFVLGGLTSKEKAALRSEFTKHSHKT